MYIFYWISIFFVVVVVVWFRGLICAFFFVFISSFWTLRYCIYRANIIQNHRIKICSKCIATQVILWKPTRWTQFEAQMIRVICIIKYFGFLVSWLCHTYQPLRAHVQIVTIFESFVSKSVSFHSLFIHSVSSIYTYWTNSN